jgi:hypothetical protein
MKTSPHPILSFNVHFSEADHQYFIDTEKSPRILAIRPVRDAVPQP